MSGNKILLGVKNASFLTAGNLISQVISFVGFLYIARILGPEEYGIYATVFSFVALFSILSLNGLDKVILREGSKDIKKIRKTYENLIGVKNIFIILSIIACIAGAIIAPYTMKIKLLILLFSINLLFISYNKFHHIVYQAIEKMKYIAMLQILNRLLFVACSVILLTLGYGVLTLFIIILISNLLTLGLNIYISRKFIKINYLVGLIWEKKLVTSAVIFSLLGIIGFLSTKIDVVMISLMGSDPTVEAGLYYVAYIIVQQGEVVRNFTAIAFFPLFVKRFNKNSNEINLKQWIFFGIITSMVVLIGTLTISIFSEQIITFLFGTEYRQSGKIFGILILYLFLIFFSLPFTNLMQATYNEKKILYFAWIGPVSNIILNFILYKHFGLIGIAYSTLIVTFVMTVLYVVVSYFTFKAYKNDPITPE